VRIGVTRAVNITLGVGIILVCALLVSGYLESRYPSSPRRAAADKGTEPEQARRPDFPAYAVILESAVFAPKDRLKLLETSKRAGEAEVETPVSFDTLMLFGTAVGRSGKNYAVIADTELKRQEVFKVGEEVFEKARLTRVKKDSAVLKADGEEFTLMMPTEKRRKRNREAKKEQPEKKRRLVRRSRPVPPDRRLPTEASESLFGVTKKTGDKQWVIDRRGLENILKDMGKVLTDARLLPYSTDGELKGFSMSEVNPKGAFYLIGLRDGDILLKVNDSQIDSPAKGVQILSGLKGESSIQLDIIRGGKPTTLNYEIR
jgi:general secretion pathway protein C